MMYLPFKENQDITPEQIWKFRSTFRDYRDQAKKNWKDVQNVGFKIVELMNNFMSDTQTEKVMKSFSASIEDVAKQFNAFLTLFDELQSSDFKSISIKSIDAIKKEIAQLKEIIEQRVQNLLEKDILAKNWIDDAGYVSLNLNKQKPFDVQLFEKRKNHLKNMGNK